MDLTHTHELTTLFPQFTYDYFNRCEILLWKKKKKTVPIVLLFNLGQLIKFIFSQIRDLKFEPYVF